MTTSPSEAVERLSMLAQVVGLKEWGHLPIISRDNAGQFQADLTCVLGLLEEARRVVEPFARFPLSGFDGEVLEVVPASPSNPAHRIEPISASHFRAASAFLEKLGPNLSAGDPGGEDE